MQTTRTRSQDVWNARQEQKGVKICKHPPVCACLTQVMTRPRCRAWWSMTPAAHSATNVFWESLVQGTTAAHAASGTCSLPNNPSARFGHWVKMCKHLTY